MNVTIYLPDALGREYRDAEAAGLIERGFLSRAAREAVERELQPIRLERRRRRLEDHLNNAGRR